MLRDRLPAAPYGDAPRRPSRLVGDSCPYGMLRDPYRMLRDRLPAAPYGDAPRMAVGPTGMLREGRLG